jgi:predicted phage terminase large subunit-like protein
MPAKYHPDWPAGSSLNLASFAARASRGRWLPAPHLRYVAAELEDLALRRCAHRGLVIEMPPRHGKSTITSLYFPAWYLGFYPEHRIILASNESNFAARWGRAVRDLILEVGPPALGIELDPATTAVADWDLVTKGGMFCCGKGGPVTGRGSNCMILDDLVKDSEEAASEAERRKLANWLDSTAFTRLEPDAEGLDPVVVLMHTRWSERDPAGLVLAGEVGAHIAWKEVRLPALAEDDDPLGRPPGYALWPERISREVLEAKRRGDEANTQADVYWFEAMFQGRPTPKSGGMFRMDEQWRRDNTVAYSPQEATRCRAWDLAASAGKGDYTVGVLVAAATPTGPFYVEDVVRGRWDEADVDATVRATAAADRDRYGPVMIRGEQEPGASGKRAAAAFVRLLAGFDAACEPASGDKATRARPLASQCGVGNVKLVRAPWNDDFIRELIRFPRGKHDDQVDAAAQALNTLALGPEAPGRAAVSGQAPRLVGIPASAYGISPV